MVSVWAKEETSLTEGGAIVLSNGSSFNLSDIPGNGFNANRLAKMTAFAQNLIDKRVSIASMVPEDPDRINGEASDDAWFLETYGNRAFIDGGDIVFRSTKLDFFLGGQGELLLRFMEVV